MAKKLHFREMPPEVRDAVDKVQRGDFDDLVLTASSISTTYGRYQTKTGIFHGRADSYITWETHSQLQGGSDSEFLHARLRDTEYMILMLLQE